MGKAANKHNEQMKEDILEVQESVKSLQEKDFFEANDVDDDVSTKSEKLNFMTVPSDISFIQILAKNFW
jgi:hypothetical protein